MKAERIAKLRRLCEKASSGPWRHKRDADGVDSFVLHETKSFEDVIICQVVAPFQSNFDDGVFIAAARTACAERLDEVERLLKVCAARPAPPEVKP